MVESVTKFRQINLHNVYSNALQKLQFICKHCYKYQLHVIESKISILSHNLCLQLFANSHSPVEYRLHNKVKNKKIILYCLIYPTGTVNSVLQDIGQTKVDKLKNCISCYSRFDLDFTQSTRQYRTKHLSNTLMHAHVIFQTM